MRNTSRLAVLAIAFLVVAFSSARSSAACSADIVIGGNKIAILVSNERYTDAPLRTPHNDAEAVGAALEKNGYQVICYKDLSGNELTSLFKRIDSELFSYTGDIFIYFTGHGWNDGDTNFFLGVDALVSHPTQAQAANVDLLVKDLSFSKARQIVFIFDICRGFGSDLENTKARRVPKNIEGNIGEPKDIVIAYSAGFGTMAFDGQKKYSPFGGSLAGYISPDWGISIQDSLSLVARNVKRLSDKQHVLQIPSFVSFSSRQLFLSTEDSGLKGLQFEQEKGNIGIRSIPKGVSLSVSEDKFVKDGIAQLIRDKAIGDADCFSFFQSLLGDNGGSLAKVMEVHPLPNGLVSSNRPMKFGLHPVPKTPS